MAKREFKVTELQATANGSFTELPVKFVWDSETQSSPRNAWEFAIKLRTVREDYVGATRPTEQVLGWNWEPFTLEGVWDDRYAGTGFAERTREAFTAMLKRGNSVRLEFENLSFTGLLTNLKMTYRQQYRQGYSFVCSPHFTAQESAPTFAPRAVANPNDYAVQSQARVDQAKDIHAAAIAAAIQGIIQGTLFSSVDGSMNDLQAKVDTINSIVSNRVLAVTDPTEGGNSVARLAQAFGALQSSASDMLVLLANAPTSAALSFEGGVNTLEFGAWSRGLAFQARAIMLGAYLAAQDLALRVDPSALAIYRPYANESLYAISNRFYGTPHRWRDIAARNGLLSVALAGTEVLVIPSATGV